MAITGTKREGKTFEAATKYVGLFEGKVIAINPSAEDYKDILGIELSPESKATDYLNVDDNNLKSLRIDVWLEDVKTKSKFKVSFYLNNTPKENKDGTKMQYVNTAGSCSWASDVTLLPSWFTKREYRQAYDGEEALYNFIRVWLGNLDFHNLDTSIELNWQNLMKGNVRELTEQIDGEYCTTVGVLATVKTVIKEEETKEYQSAYNKKFLPTYDLKKFKLVDYSNPVIISSLQSKKNNQLKPHERFVVDVTGEYGCRDFFVLKELREYNADDNLVASNQTISEDGGDY